MDLPTILPANDGREIAIGPDEPDRDAVAITYGPDEIRLTPEDARALSNVLRALFTHDQAALAAVLRDAANAIGSEASDR